jgi:FkbM family methyltransferase
MTDSTFDLVPPPGIDLEFGGLRLRVRPREEFVFYATFVAGEYDPLKMRRGDLVLDAGANIGDFTIRASNRVGQEGTVIAVEPNPRLLPYLAWNLKVNRCRNVKLLTCAVGRPGKVVLIETPDGGSVGSTTARQGPGVEVVSRSIDEIFSSLDLPAPDILKMDIEGAETEALAGFHGLSRVRELAVELHGPHNLRAVPQILQKHHEIWYHSAAEVWIRSFENTLTHPLDFAIAELKSGFVATRGLAAIALGSKHPVPSVQSNDVALVYGRRRRTT